jgi:NAD(P)-dependent dehydrogenase (short-subunit alcohol dehydrogenase family)
MLARCRGYVRDMPQIAALVDTLMDRTVVPGYTRLGPAVRRHLSTWPADPPPDALSGRRALVTGASSGLGAATAEGLAALGAEVVLVVRDTDKGAAVVRGIQGRHPLARLDVQRCDLADLDDVRRFVAADGEPVDVLVHNAGAMPPSRTESPQGHELTMALHVLAPVLMTDLIGERLRGGRVLMVTSGGMYTQRLRDDDPEYLDGDYSATTAYARSKRAQVELLPLLQRRWPATDVHATHPGWADTPGVADSLPTFRRLTAPLLRDAAEGADTTIWLAATQPPPPGGQLWHDRRPRPTQLLPRTRTGVVEAERMWAWVAAQTGLSG